MQHLQFRILCTVTVILLSISNLKAVEKDKKFGLSLVQIGLSQWSTDTKEISQSSGNKTADYRDNLKSIPSIDLYFSAWDLTFNLGGSLLLASKQNSGKPEVREFSPGNLKLGLGKKICSLRPRLELQIPLNSNTSLYNDPFVGTGNVLAELGLGYSIPINEISNKMDAYGDVSIKGPISEGMSYGFYDVSGLAELGSFGTNVFLKGQYALFRELKVNISSTYSYEFWKWLAGSITADETKQSLFVGGGMELKVAPKNYLNIYLSSLLWFDDEMTISGSKYKKELESLAFGAGYTFYL